MRWVVMTPLGPPVEPDVGGDPLLDELAQLAGRGVRPGLQRDGGGDLLAEVLVRDPDHGGLVHLP
jgi:hypothetical protein